jgi:hypothetical protein
MGRVRLDKRQGQTRRRQSCGGDRRPRSLQNIRPSLERCAMTTRIAWLVPGDMAVVVRVRVRVREESARTQEYRFCPAA